MNTIQRTEKAGQLGIRNTVGSQLKALKFSGLLSKNRFIKKAANGCSISGLIYRMMITLYMDKPLKCLWEDKKTLAECLKGPKKDNYYRLCKNPNLNWRRLLLGLFIRLLRPLQKITKLKNQVLILDDTSNPKTGKKIEFLSVQYDHSTHSYYRGFTQLHLGWSDGHLYLPIDFCIKVGNNIVSSWKKAVDYRTCGGNRRKEAGKSKLEQSLSMLKRAYANGVSAGYVLFDTWFAKPAFILSVLKTGYQSVFNLPKNEKMWRFIYQNETWTMKDLYRLLKKTKQFKKTCIGEVQQEVASVIVEHENGLKMKLVFCKTTHNKKWLVFGSTDIQLSASTILETYSKRWKIETFFKSCKQLLRFGQEQSVDFDVQVSMTTIRLIAYAVATIINRNSLDERTLGALFEDIHNEFSSLNLDMNTLMAMFDLVVVQMNLNETGVLKFKKVLHTLCDDFMYSGIYYEEKKVA